MVVESVVSSFVVGKIRKRKITNIGNIELNGWYLFIISALIEISANLFVAYSKSSFTNIVYENFVFIHLISYLIIFRGLYKNRDKKSMWFILAGTLLNFICIMANGGQMPIWLNGLKIAGLVPADATTATLDLTHKLVSEQTNLKFLSDIIPLPKPYPNAKVFSIGDLIIAVGVFIFLQEAMKDKKA